ncbi:uncharacterized protein N7477_008406 [Penicillium maclennaniae]|uniref:uncharacterized protein n=1 Tax=Penicillium maclennaniae TaxID=1343394 RepID=UPI002540DF85|nr:uncharacterized protein N7477_008406 [Penicillium maclennaniae]KAJ5665958.1 hypothetical protein N7477_008406 [Penicillium maclennaniae]
MAGTLPPLFDITDSDEGGYAAVAVYTLLVLTLVMVLARLSTRWYIGGVLHSDDILLAISTLFGILQSIFVQLAISNGLGRKLATIGSDELVRYLKYEYAAQLLLIVTVAFSKISLGLLFKNLMTSRRYLRTNQVLMGVIIAWAVASILALALRCSMPTPWMWNSPDKCIDQAALFEAIAALNIVTDLAIVLLPCMLLRTVQLSHWKRFRIMALLASRILVCIATGIGIHFTVKMLQSSDIPWANTDSTIWDQVMMNLSIMTTAVPALGRLVIELQPSLYAFTINEDPVESSSAADKYKFSAMGKSFNQTFPAERGKCHRSSGQTNGWRESLKDDAESTKGLVNTPIMIQQTIHFEVH